MAVTVVPLLTEIDDADTTTGWAGNSGGQDTFVYVEGGATPASWTWQARKNAAETGTFTPASAVDVSTGTTGYTSQHAYFWFRCDVAQFTQAFASNGLLFRVTDGTGNFTEWRFAGSDTWRGEWKCIPIDLANTTNVVTSSGTLNLADITLFSWTVSTQNINFRAIDNTWNDVFFIGEGISGYGTAWNLADMAADAQLEANQYGVFEQRDGVLFSLGRVEIGDGTNQTTYSSDAEVLFFGDPATSGLGGGVLGFTGSNLYAFQCLGGTSSTFSHTNGVISAAGNQTFFLDLDDTGFSTITFTGNTVINAGESRFWADGTNAVIKNNTFLSCGSIYPQGSDFEGNVITNTTATSATVVANLNELNDCTFTGDNTSHAVELTAVPTNGMTMIWNCKAPSGYTAGSTGTGTTTNNDAHIFITASTANDLTISVSDGAVIPSIKVDTGYTGTVTVSAGLRTFTITAIDINTKAAIQNARVIVTADSGGGLAQGTVIIDKVLTDVNGQVSDTRSYSSDQPFIGDVRLASSGVFYKAQPISGTISSSSDTSITVSLIPDE